MRICRKLEWKLAHISKGTKLNKRSKFLLYEWPYSSQLYRYILSLIKIYINIPLSDLCMYQILQICTVMF